MNDSEKRRFDIIEMLIHQGLTSPDELIWAAKMIESYISNQSSESS